MDILKLDNVSDQDTLMYYQKYNPFIFKDNISNKKIMSDASNFFTQLKTIFFPKLNYNHRLELV